MPPKDSNAPIFKDQLIAHINELLMAPELQNVRQQDVKDSLQRMLVEVQSEKAADGSPADFEGIANLVNDIHSSLTADIFSIEPSPRPYRPPQDPPAK